MTSPDKKYIVVDEKSGQTFRFGADQWATDQHDFMADYPGATIIEYDSYTPENLKDNDTVFVNTEDGTYSFTADEWKKDEESFRKNFKKVEPSVARGVDYYYNQALDLESQIEQKKQSIADWEQRNSAEREKRLQWNPDTPAVPFIEDMQAAHKETEIETEGNTLYNELDDLERRFYANPRVSEAMEENKRLREEAQRKYVADLQTEAEGMLAEAGEDVATEKLRTHETMMNALDGQYGSLFSAKGPSGETKEQVREYNKAGAALTMLQHAKDIREGKADGFFEGMGNVVKKDIKELMYQSESESFVQVALLLKRLNDEIGSLDNLTSEDIDKHLNKEEALLLRSYFELMSAQKEARVNWKDNWKYTAGEIAGESIKFALEFAAIGGLADDVAKGATKGLTLAMEQWIDRGLQKGSKALLRKGVAWTADKVLRGGIKSAIVTAMRPSTYATIAQHLPEQDEEGNIRLGRNALIGALDAGIETISEMSGDLISKGLGVVMKPIGKGLGKVGKGVATKMFGEAVQNVKFNKWSVFFGGVLPDYVKAAGFHGVVPEMLEEVVGNAMRLSYGDDSLYEMFKDGNGRAMLLGFIPMTIFGGAASVAQFRAVDERAAKIGERLGNFLASKGYEQGRIEALTERRTDKSPLELDVQMRLLSEELKKNGATEEELKLVDEYAMAVAEFQTLRGITEMREKQDLQEENRALTQQYGKVDVNGQVTTAETKDGRTVFLVSERDGNGQYAAVDQQTGKQSFITDADIASVKDEKGNDIAKRQSVPLNTYLGDRLNQRNRLKEAERMLKEKGEQIARLNELMPEKLNLGTKTEPVMVAVKSRDAKGVVVVDENGNEQPLSWEAVGRVMGLPIRVFTDEEISELEQKEIALEREARRAARAEAYAENEEVAKEVDEISEKLKKGITRPEAAYIDEKTGKVDETSFWENDPEGYCEWNDREHKGDPTDSLDQIQNSLDKLYEKQKGLEKTKSDDPVERKAVNEEKARLQERIGKLEGIKMGYVQKALQKVKETAEDMLAKEEERGDLVIAMRERINAWRERFNLDESKLAVYESVDEVADPEVKKMIMRGDYVPGWNTGKHAFIYLPQIDSVETLDKTVMHEVVTHYGFRALFPNTKEGQEEFNKLMDKVWNMMSDASRRHFSFYANIASKEGDERRRAAAEEFVAHVGENVVMDKATTEEKSFWKRFVEFFTSLFDKMQTKLTGVDVAEIVRNNYNRLAQQVDAQQRQAEEQQEQAVEEAVAETPAPVESVTDIADAAQQDPDAINLAPTDDTKHSYKTENYLADQIRGYAKSREGKKAGWTKETLEEVIAETESLITAIHNSSTGNEFYDEFASKDPTIRMDWRDGQLKPIVTWTRANIEYKYDMSADLLCVNNEGLEEVLSSEQMVALMPLFNMSKKDEVTITDMQGKEKTQKVEIGFSQDDYLELYSTLKDLGFVVPCKGCFDAAGRFKMLPSVAYKFAAAVNAVIDERNADPEAFDAALKAKAGKSATVEGLPTAAKTKLDAIRAGVAGDNLTEHVKWTQLMSADGQTKMLSDWGGIFRAWQRTGAGRPKDKLLPEPYYGDIVSQQTTIIGKYGEKTPSFKDILVNTGTGLRRNSHSEFRPVLAVDEIQFMRDAFIKNLTVFKYMKELDDVRLFGQLGVKFNMSFFPEFVEGTKAAGLDKDGNYIPSEESVGAREFPYIGEDGKKHYDGKKGWEEAQKHVNKDVSLSSVILSIPHLIKALTDVPTTFDKSGIWGSLIPFHSSGATSLALFLQGLGRARANGVGHGFEEAFTRYGEGVTNFEAVQNDRFGAGWVIVEGKKEKVGTEVEEGHKLEFVNGKHYYNKAMGLHLFASTYVFDNELPEGALNEDGTLNLSAKELKKIGHAYEIDYNNKVREIGTPTAYEEAANYYLEFLPTLGLKPRFDFEVPEEIFLQMCEDANVDPAHPKLGWKGAGNAWNPIHSAAYYSLFCDYGMTDPATGEWAPHNPVGYVNENGEREFRMPENTVEIVKEGLDRYSEIRRGESVKINDAIKEFARRSVEKGRISQEAVDSVLGEQTTMFKTEDVANKEVMNLVLDSTEMNLPQTREEAIGAIPKSGKICKTSDGTEVRVSRRSVRHSVLHKNKDSYALFGVIDGVLANAVKIGEIPVAEDEIGKTNSVSVYYAPVRINGTQYSARIVVKETIHNEKILDILSLYNVALHNEKTPSNTNVGVSEETRVYSDGVKSAYKVKEIIHNSQAEDKKLVGIENETTFFKTSPRTAEQRTALFEAAKEEFGVTNNFGVAGYMLPDGTLLDFSEAKDGGPANKRTRDHREVGSIIEDRDYDTRSEYITDFLNEGAIRIMPESDAVNLSVAPSAEQREKLLDYFYKKNGYVILEIDDQNGKSAAYMEYDKGTSPYRIMRDIENYFNEGIVPQQNTMFKTNPHQSSLEEIIDMFYAWNQDESLKPLFRKAYDFCNEIDLDVKFVSEEEMVRLEGKGEGEQGARGINWGEKIRLNSDVFANIPDQLKASIILHEMIHAATNYILVQKEEDLEYENHREAKRELEAIFDEIKNKFPDQYGSTDVNEMVAEMAKPEFRDIMKQGTWWERFLNAIRRLLGISEKDYDRLTPTLAWVYELMDNPSFELFEEAKPNSEEYTLFKTAIAPEVRKEMDVIAAQAMVNGNYLLAPNGKDTKLTPEQWALIRTKNFKRWFGDWTKITRNEDGTWNIPEGVSHVIDQETGEPMVVYHQTNSVVYINRETGENWDELDWRARQEWDERDDWEDYWEEQDFNTFSRVNARTTNEFDGFFFAPEYDEYHEYGDRTIPAFLNIKNPASREDYYIDSSKNNAGREERIRLQSEGFDGVIREEDGQIWEYIAFEPNQIKSATENNGEYSENEDIRFKFIGEKGAAMLDKAEESMTRLDNLAVAREMENAGKDAKTIKIATGWERGVDGLWRYEISDVNFRLSDDYAHATKLEQAIEDEELFAAYPELRNVNVVIDTNANSDKGSFDREQNKIYALGTNETEAKNVLLHEIQHAVQREEGFARGSSTFEMAEKFGIQDTFMLTREHLQSMMDAVMVSKALPDDVSIEDLRSMWRNAEGEEERLILTDILMQMSDGASIEEVRKTLSREYEKAKKSLEAELASSDSAYNKYLAVAGEVEAGNVVRRRHYDLERRRNTLASETEYVAREDQIVLMEGLDVAEMGHKTDAKMEKIGKYFEGKTLDATQQTIVDTYSGATNNKKVVIKDKSGVDRYIIMRQGNDQNFGTKHSLYRHFETTVGVISEDDILLIPQVVAQGVRTAKKNVIKYELKIDKTTYTLLLDKKGQNEIFHDFFSSWKIKNKANTSTSSITQGENTQSSARISEASALIGDKDTNKSDTDNTSEEKDFLFKTRTKPAPIKTQEVYKLMRLGADGRLYPLYIDSAEGIELKVWYDADSPNMGDIENLEVGYAYKIDKEGNVVEKKKFNKTAKGSYSALPTKEQIDNATLEESRWVAVSTYADGSKAFYNVGINGSGTSSLFGMRPGWHAGSLPTMRQIGKGSKKNLRDDSFVWVRGYIPADVDYQAEADANSSKDIQTHIPTDGYYLKATNANKKASQADKMGWYIAGAFYADEIISDAEARSVIDEWNKEHPDAKVEYDFPRESGREFDPARGGLVESDTMFKTSKSTSDIDVDELVNTGRQKVNAERKIAADARMDKLRAVNDALAELNRIVTLDETAEADAIIDMARKLATSNDTSYRLKLALDPLITAAESATADAEREDAVENLKRLLIDNNVKEAAFAQREYDEKTVKSIAQQAKELLEVGALADMTRGEIKRLIGAITSATGKRDLTKSVNRLMDVMIANQLRMGRENIDKFLKVRGKKVDARGVEVQGKLDIEGQQIMDAVRENIGDDLVDILFRMVDVEEKLSDPSETVRRNAENELAGLELARQYVETIKESEKEEKKLRKEVKDAEEEYKQGRLDRKAFRDFVKTVDQAIRENRIERVKAYQALAESFAKMMTRSIENAGQLREAEKRRIQRIQHFANSDMQGMPSNEHGSVDSKWLNNPVVRFFLKPLATFDQMLRQFGSKSVNGEGYLWNHFMRGWLKATEAEYKGVQAAHNELDAKAQELFGRDGVKRWSDIFEIDRKLPGATLPWWDGGEMKDHEITQGNMLYIYMVNKMTDGKMKLRKMGIDESDVARLVDNMDPRFIEAADWIQDVFLPGLRDRYNAVHERLFGAPMAAIDSYFPIRVLANARVREVDLGVAEGNAKPSTMTGSIIKRTRNSLALDILGSNAFDVVLEHIQQMEHWAAFAEFNRDLNTLLSYRLFRNRVQNMSGIYGAGKEAWNNFRSVAEMAAGVYEPASKSDSIDKTAMNLAKGVTAAKISFRVYTAIKQLLSMPAFISDASAVNLAKTLANPKGAWDWAMENLPLFEKRWKSRQAGDSRLMQTESDWKIWKDKVVELAGRYGMSPNAFVDAITVAIGAKSIYETKKSKYLKYGYPEAEADEKAKQDATILFNESQQSNESAFLSTMQVDRTVASVAFSLFRNSSMGYERMFVDALRNIKHLLTKGYKAESIEFMRKQFVRDGLTEDQAERAAERAYGKSLFSAAMRAVTFGFVVQFAWNLGGYLPYLIAGDDDDEKKDMIKDAARHALIGGPVEGLTGGSIISEAGNMIAKGDDFKNYSPTLLPVVSDFKKVLQMFAYDEVAAANEVFNILVQAGVGVNPQTFTDIGVAIYDACNGDLETMKEATLCLLRILQIPQSQADKVYIDEIDFTADKGLELTIQEFAERYADYKVRRGAPVTGWMYSDEKQKEREEKYIARFKKMAEEYKRTRGNEEAKAYYEYLDNEYKEVSTTLADLKSKMKAEEMKGNEMGSLEFAEMLDDYMKSDVFQRYSLFGGKAKAIEKIRDMLLKVDERTMDLMEDVMLQLRKEMVEEMEQAKAETDAND